VVRSLSPGDRSHASGLEVRAGGDALSAPRGAVSRRRIASVGMEGTLLALSTAPIVLGAWVHGSAALVRRPALGVTAGASLLVLVVSAVWFFRRPRIARALATAGVVGALALVVPALLRSPSATLAAAIATLLLLYLGLGYRSASLPDGETSPTERAAQRARWAGFTALPLLLSVAAFYRGEDRIVTLGAVLCALVSGLLAVQWAHRAAPGLPRGRPAMTWLAFLGTGAAVLVGLGGGTWLEAAVFWPVTAAWIVPAPRHEPVQAGTWLEPLVGHPARLLVTTFLVLCALGTVLLATPWVSATGEAVAPLDAAFTAVSAVCVTGLTVLDTPRDFGGFGQGCILLLIQVGGLGIMSVSVVALHALGRRLSLRQERVLASMIGERRGRLIGSLRLVVRFAVVVECLGALALLPLFLGAGDRLPAALWRSVFTAVSAFCNAGFALQSDSLLSYQTDPAVLHVVAVLIILGGLSPAVTVALPGLVRGRRGPPFVPMVAVTTLVLLVGGWILFAVLEWNQSLAGLSYAERLHNAWFQSATLRTAGFNSVDIPAVRPPTLLAMLVFMFIGGSPGGTAGGIKTTTFAVLVVGMFSAFRGRGRLLIGRRHIGHDIVYKALAVVATGLVVWMAAVIALHLTQSIATRDIVFEATSALGTVGLSTGATSCLDGTGKVIIMIVMFLGRIGPLTMFTVLSQPGADSRLGYPEVKIPIA
jgi:trk system potassium uptake protein TrkH